MPSVEIFDDAVVVFVVDDDAICLQLVSLFGGTEEVVFFDSWAFTTDEWQDEWAIGSQCDDLERALHLFLVHVYADRVVNVGLALVGAKQFSNDGGGMGAPLVVGLHFLDTEITGARGEHDGGNHRNGRDNVFLHRR